MQTVLNIFDFERLAHGTSIKVQAERLSRNTARDNEQRGELYSALRVFARTLRLTDVGEEEAKPTAMTAFIKCVEVAAGLNVDLIVAAKEVRIEDFIEIRKQFRATGELGFQMMNAMIMNRAGEIRHERGMP